MKSNKLRNITLIVIAVLMALSLTFLAPSGAILPEAAARYQDEVTTDMDSEDAWDYSLFNPIGYLASTGLIDVILPTNDVAYLPLDLTEPGRVPIEENFTETGYQDDTIIVEITEERLYDSTFHIAYVKIATPSQMRTAIAGKFGSGRTLKSTVFSQSMNAVVLINGDYYTRTDSGNGYIVRQGEIHRWKPSSMTDLLLVDENSDFHIIIHGDTKSVEEDAVDAFLTEHELINAFYFGPALVVDGELMEIPEEYLGDPHDVNPRAAIGQLAPLTYALVTVDGRTDESKGVTVEELAAYMHEIGCEQAYALDGGNSSALVFHHQLLSIKDVHERDVSDVIYFATAIDN
ncbi:MAG: phosphodiester glycosidase family protein [Clostridiales bacterium]|nr:phosphodiester glycosidase family protein [Clostridiales bacterium]